MPSLPSVATLPKCSASNGLPSVATLPKCSASNGLPSVATLPKCSASNGHLPSERRLVFAAQSYEIIHI